MTIAELINILSEFDQTREVVVFNSEKTKITPPRIEDTGQRVIIRADAYIGQDD